jgi:pimeloyl-ACP methyl ester carboxylesterase
MEEGERRAMEIANRAPWLLRGLMGTLAAVERLRSGTIVTALLSTLPECDRRVVARPEVAASLADSYRRAFAQGTRGQVLDWALIDRPWGFDPGDIRTRVLVWQGDRDGRVPLHHAEDLAARIPDCGLYVYRGEGHMIAFSRIEEILTTLVEGLPLA